MKRSFFSAQAQTDAEREAVRQAALDYVEGVYNVDPSRIERSVHPKLVKLGFSRPPDEDAYRPGSTTTFERLVEIAKNYNKEGDRKSTRLNSSHLGISYAVFCL